MKNKDIEKIDYLRNIQRIAEAAKDSGFPPDLIHKVSKEIDALANFLVCSDIQIFFLSVIFNLNFSRSSVDLEQIADFMNCTPVMIARYLNDLEELCQGGLLKREFSHAGSRRKGSNSLDRVSYFVHYKLLACLLGGFQFTPESEQAKDEYELLAKITTVISDREAKRIGWAEMEKEVQLVVNSNEHLEFTKKVMACNLDNKSLCLLFAMYSAFIEGDEEPDFNSLVGGVFPDFRSQLEVRKAIMDGSSDLVKKELITLEDGYFRNDRVLRLSERALEFFLKEDSKLFNQKKVKRSKDVILSSEIIKKNLIFNPEDGQKVQFLTRTLMPGTFNKLVQRLRDSGMKTGVTILFHGAPGVGKTECALQLARETGRDIRMVDISSTKSMWFGESEKIIKGIFDQYRRQVATSELAPILVFNEADGVLGSRKQLGHSALDQTENTIQNILLQEIEDLEGILIATTNLKQNLDKAFDRRFLYKIMFEKPTFINRAKIWKEKISGLSLQSLKELAEKYEFTGGQIDNIARKVVTNNVLNGKTRFDQMIMFCEEEVSERQVGKIGYLR